MLRINISGTEENVSYRRICTHNRRTCCWRMPLYHVLLEIQTSLNTCKDKSFFFLWFICNVSSAGFWTKIRTQTPRIRCKISEMNGGVLSWGESERRFLEKRQREQQIYKSISTALSKYCEGDGRFTILTSQMKLASDKGQSESSRRRRR